MVLALLSGFIIGFVLAIPPGPIGMASVRVGLRQGWTAAVRLAIGAGLLDTVYCGLAYWASNAVIDVIVSLEREYQPQAIAAQCCVVGVMIWYGVRQVREHPVPQGPANGTSNKLLAVLSAHGPFLIGVGYALANMANPTFLPAVVTMTTFVHKLQLFQDSELNGVMFAIGFGAGNAGWLMVLVRMVLRLKSRFTPTLIHRIQQFSGVTLVAFAVFYAYRLFQQSSW